MKNAFVIGAKVGKDNIGGALVRRCPDFDFNPIGIVTSTTVTGRGGAARNLLYPGNPQDAIRLLEEIDKKPDIVFIAIPPMEKGEVALAYMQHYLNLGIPVVSAEKKAMAYNSGELVKHLPILGVNAMVGGNARFISTSRNRRLRHYKVKVLMVLNGTMNYDLSSVQDGSAKATAAEIARKLGYAEPDTNPDKRQGPLRQVQGELYGDVTAKATVYHNLVCAGDAGPFLTPDAFQVNKLEQADFNRFFDAGSRYRYFVEFSNDEPSEFFDVEAAGSFQVHFEDWYITGGFVQALKGTFRGDWAPNGVDNGFLIEYLDGHNGPVRLSAPGAGWGPTTDTMFQDAAEVLNLAY